MSCDFAVSVLLKSFDGATTLIDFNDQTIGLSVVEVSPLDESVDRGIVSSPFVDGEFPAWERDGAGVYGVLVGLDGATWAEVEAARIALRAAYRSATRFLLVVSVEGVTSTFIARRPDVTSGTVTSSNLTAKYRELLLSFPVQPNPTVTGV